MSIASLYNIRNLFFFNTVFFYGSLFSALCRHSGEPSAAGSTIIQFLPGDISNICGWKPPAGCCSKPAIRLRKSLRNPDSRMSPILSGSSTASTASRRFSSVMVPESDIFRHVFLIENGAPRTILINGRMWKLIRVNCCRGGRRDGNGPGRRVPLMFRIWGRQSRRRRQPCSRSQ